MNKNRIFKTLNEIEATVRKKTVKGYINELKKDPDYKKFQDTMRENESGINWVNIWEKAWQILEERKKEKEKAIREGQFTEEQWEKKERIEYEKASKHFQELYG